MNDRRGIRRVYSPADGRRVPACAWNGCDYPSYSWLPVCFEHALLVAEAVTPVQVDANTLTRASKRRRAQAREEDLAATRGDQPGWIYYIHTDGKVKIGYSTDITRRLRAYPPGSELLAVHPGTPDLERAIHHQFDAYRVAGREWFRPCDEIHDHCERVRTEHGSPQRFAPKVRNPHAPKQATTPRGWSGR